jgi:phosphomethylpyrimidine synthase
MCGPKFCSMAITDKVREYAAQHGVAAGPEALELGMEEKAAEFVAAGADVYLEDPAARDQASPTEGAAAP